MCYAIPGKVVAINADIAVIDYFGEKREAYADVEEVRVGDYVFAQGGFIVQMIQEEDAICILDGWKETFFRLRERDRRLSEDGLQSGIAGTDIANILKKAEKGTTLSRDELVTLLKCSDKRNLELLYRTANILRQRNHRNSCCVHGIIEFSNICRNDCAYCGIRRENLNVKRYRMEVDEIVDVACDAVNKLGFKALVFQSGEDDYYTTERLVDIIKRIRKKCGMLIILSIGERNVESCKVLYDAGARGVLLRFETSNPNLFAEFHSTIRYEERVQLLKSLRDIGYIIVTGSIIGLPGQREEDILDDILLAGSLDTEMYSFGPLVPHPETPLGDTQQVNIDAILKVIAVTRILDPNGSMLVTSAVERLFGKEGIRRGLMAGGNSMMINLTPKMYRKLYSIYPGKGSEIDDVKRDIRDTLELLYSLGRAPTDIGIGAAHG
jgi:biotin synthase